MKNNFLQQEVGKMKIIGVLGIQGAVSEHIQLLEQIPNVQAKIIKTISELDEIDGLILPGGESTAMARVLKDFDMIEPLREKITGGLPTWGTCAGMILLARKITDGNPTILGVMDITVKRNAYGRQLDSFVTQEQVPAVCHESVPLVFIRAPFVETIGKNVEILHKTDGEIVACREEHLLATSFHPELTDSLAFHQYFVKKICTGN